MESKNSTHFTLLIIFLVLIIGVLIAYVFYVHNGGLRKISYQTSQVILPVSMPPVIGNDEVDANFPEEEIAENPIYNEVQESVAPEPETPIELPDVENPSEGIYDCGMFPCYTSSEFLDLYNGFEKLGTLSFLTKYIYNIKDVDDYIKGKAEARGYQQRGFADETKLISFEGTKTRPEVKNAYIKMRDAMAKENIRLHFVSAYRSSTHQRSIFTNKMAVANPQDILTGMYDAKIEEILTVSSIPAYSKHHSGYAVDFGCGNDYLVYTFNETPCYAWLSKNNFENAKRFGFIPSYPDGAGSQGPNPEPWEYVWVGSDYIKNPTGM